jgi:LmbE family N-acetylglucosaminyl deacetylase
MNSNWRRWLFVSPHADDSEFGCGGLLAQLARRPDLDVELVVLTSREETTGESADVTRQYQRDALDALGLQRANISLSRLHSRRLPDLHEEVRQTLARVKRNFKPDVIFTTPYGDRMQDHHAVAEEVARIFRGDSVMEYEVVSSSIAFAPSVYLEIDEEDLRLKVEALHCHQGQSHKSYFSPDVIRSLARLRGAHSSRYPYAEAFRNQVLLSPSLAVSSKAASAEKLSANEVSVKESP